MKRRYASLRTTEVDVRDPLRRWHRFRYGYGNIVFVFAMAFHYREAASADVPAMVRCRVSDAAAGPADARMAAYLDGQHHPRQALAARTAFVALDDAHVVGYIAGHATTRFGCAGEVQYLYVAPSHRRAGVACELLRCLARWFEGRGIARVCVNADVDSAGAVPFYTALGATRLTPHWYIWDDIRTVHDSSG